MAITRGEQDAFYKLLGRQIKNLRVKSNISQEDLAKHLGFVSRVSIVQIESGKQKIQLHTLLEVASFFNVPLQQLLPSLDLSKGISTSFAKKISKEVSREISNDPLTVEKIKSFIRLSSSSK